jgi:alcohol dehydrogenase class IV
VAAQLEKAQLTFDVFDNCGVEAPLSAIEELSNTIVNDSYDLLIGVGGGE